MLDAQTRSHRYVRCAPLRTFADFPGFSELERTARPPLDLPLFG